MRVDTAAFVAKNTQLAKRPRYTIELAFDTANTILWYLTSHTDAATPPGAAIIANVVEGISGTSQVLNPDQATATIGAINFKVVDRGRIVTSTLGSQIALGRSTRRQRVRVYIGYEGLAWSDYTLVQTQLVSIITYADGMYDFKCLDVQREMRKTIFDLATTTLAASLDAVATTVNVVANSLFGMLTHGNSYSDAPNATVGYIKIQDEVIRYTGKDVTGTQFTGCTRGALNTRAVEHAVDLTTSADRRTAVTEYVFLELPAIKLMHALLTGRMPDVPIGDTASSAVDSSLWVAGATPTSYTLNQDIAGESFFAQRTGPSGDLEVVNCCKSLDTPAGDPGADGGWSTSNVIPVDKTKGYLFACFFKRLSTGTLAGGNVSAYWGLHTNSANDILSLNGVASNNAYFLGTAVTTFMPNADQWYLAVGFVHENGYGTTDTNISGVYDLNGVRIVAGTEYKWPADTTLCAHRAYHYYNQSISGEVQQMARPRVIACAAADAPAMIASICNTVAKLPTKWNLGIPASYVQSADFVNKRDLFDWRDDQKGVVVRLEDLKKTDGKQFIETELALLLGAFMPVYASGALGLRRMSNILAGASYVRQLDEHNVVDAGELTNDFESLHNNLQISWNWEPARGDFTRVNLLLDQPSITVHQLSDPLKLKFRGLHGSRHTSAMLAQRFDALRDRYSGPPLRLPLTVLPSCNGLEIGDVVRVRLAKVRDFVANGSLDRSFEIQNIQMDWMSGREQLKLFASSQAPGALAPSSDASVLSSAWYTGTGTAISSALTVTGSNPGHVSANGTLTGNADMNAAASVFYYNGDLQIDAGVTVNLVGNVQLRVNGFLQNNGTLNGKGGGIAGAAALLAGAITSASSINLGTPGFIGSTEAGGGLVLTKIPTGFGGGSLFRVGVHSTQAIAIVGANSTVPALNLIWTGTVLQGIASEMRGTSGSTGLPVYGPGSVASNAPGGAGGNSGAGLCIVSRGFNQGASAKIDLSGGDGAAGSSVAVTDPNGPTGFTLFAGSGAGGAPGALAIILDGAGLSATGLGETSFIALNGKTPQPAGRLSDVDGPAMTSVASSFFLGYGDGTTFPLPGAMPGGYLNYQRIQYVLNNSAAPAADLSPITLASPTSLALVSGTTELLVQGDGTVIVRIKATWGAAPDSRVAGYDLQFKRSTDSIWTSSASVIGQATVTAWIAQGIQDGINYDVRVRAAGATREVSDWVTISNFPVVGKTAKPTDVTGLSFIDPFLSWNAITDADRRGYIVKYNAGTSTTWVGATAAHKEGYVTPTKFDTSAFVGGQTTFLVKSLDTSGNESVNATALTVDLRPAAPTSFLVSRQPDGTRQFTWALTTPPDDLAGYRIRYFLGTTSDWTAMTALNSGLLTASPFESNQLAAGTYTFAIKSVDRAGNESATALFIQLTIGDPRIAGSIEDFMEEPTWSATKTNCHVDVTSGWLIADDDGGTWTNMPATWTAWSIWNHQPKPIIEYTKLVDIGTKAQFVPLVTMSGDGLQTIKEQHSDDGITYSAWADVGPQLNTRYLRARVSMAKRVMAADFDGTNDYMTRGAGLTGAVDSKLVTLVCWFRMDGGDAAAQRFLSSSSTLAGTGDRFRVNRSTLNQINVIASNAAGATILTLASTGTYIAGATWRCLMFSCDLSDVAKRWLYVGDTSDLGTVTTYTNDTIDFTVADWSIGANPDGNVKLNGCLADVHLYPGVYVDFSVQANRRKFFSAAGKPVETGAAGIFPFDVSPIMLHRLREDQAASKFATNLGTGGNMTITGLLDVASSSPSD